VAGVPPDRCDHERCLVRPSTVDGGLPLAEDIQAGRLRAHEVAVELVPQAPEEPVEVAAPSEPTRYL
jgi:hypothetical protein